MPKRARLLVAIVVACALALLDVAVARIQRWANASETKPLEGSWW